MKTQMKAGNLVAAYVDDPMGRRLVLAQSDPSPVTGKVYSAVDPIQIGTTQTELCCALDKVGDEPQRRIFWHAPRHGVTTALVAAMQLRPELTFAYANSRTGHTDSILRKIARPGVFPADRPLVGTGISGTRRCSTWTEPSRLLGRWALTAGGDRLAMQETTPAAARSTSAPALAAVKPVRVIL